MAFSPTVLAHASVATTDACFALFSVIALAAMTWYWTSPSSLRYLLMGAAIGVAMSAKQSAVFLFPAAFILFVAIARKRNAPSLTVKLLLRVVTRSVVQTSGLVFLAFLVNWGFYGFATAPLLEPGMAHPTYIKIMGTGPAAEHFGEFLDWFPIPMSVHTFIGQVAHGIRGHQAFLMGATSYHGWWYYFPIAFLVKSTPAELAILLVTLGVLPLAARRGDAAMCLWSASIVIFCILCITSSLNLGHRYLLPLYPMLVLCSIDGLARMTAHKPKLFGTIGGVLLAVQAWSAISVAPHYLSYFNFLVGGPSQGYRYLVDSSLDWGQDLPSLRREMVRLGCDRVLVAYFGPTAPEAYGVRSVEWNTVEEAQVGQCDCVAISATYLQGIDYTNFSRFRALDPAGRAGYSIFIYDAKDATVQAALAAARQGLVKER
jgi:4-amino-4-deoxy-L-arabinose transferase-like glycosyltransferase